MPVEWAVRVIMRAMLPVLLVLTLVELGSGLILGNFEAQLFRYPSLLVLVPTTVETMRSLGSVLAARLSTSFHLGTLSFSPRDDEFAGNAVATLALAVTVLPVIGAGTWVVTLFVSGDTSLTLQKVVLIALSSGISPAALAVVVTFSTTYLVYRFGLDPDDVIIPVATNLCGVLGIIVLFGMAQMLV